ncbi:MAG: hypothetical protein HZA46_15320 [Planctomycetales bacterium]|nr:hypothetical protein [Planctomycetales bacterium]
MHVSSDHRCRLAVVVIVLLAMSHVLVQAQTPVRTEAGLRARAIQETATPVRPGVPGERPFWNGRAVQFLYAPAFDFKEVPDAKSYGSDAQDHARPATGSGRTGRLQ